MNLQDMRAVIRYDADTGEFIWLAKIGHSQVGMRAGRPHNQGYWVVSVGGKAYMAHRLAIYLETGEWPAGDVDHINGVRNDNRLCNLRCVSRSLNMQNQRHARKNSSTGLLGVVPNRKRFSAQIRTNGKTKCLGTYDTPEEAHAAYVRAKRLHHIAGQL